MDKKVLLLTVIPSTMEQNFFTAVLTPVRFSVPPPIVTSSMGIHWFQQLDTLFAEGILIVSFIDAG